MGWGRTYFIPVKVRWGLGRWGTEPVPRVPCPRDPVGETGVPTGRQVLTGVGVCYVAKGEDLDRESEVLCPTRPPPRGPWPTSGQTDVTDATATAAETHTMDPPSPLRSLPLHRSSHGTQTH